MKKTLLTLCLLPLTLWANDKDRIQFEPSALDLKEISQGEIKNVKISGKNTSKDTIHIEQVIAQGIGPQNISAPKLVLPEASFSWSFDYNTAYLKGQTKENITFVISGDELYPLELTAKIIEPIFISPKVFDIGYLEPIKSTQSLLILASSKNDQSIALKKAYPGITIETTKTKVILKDDILVEDEKGQMGFKVLLKLDGKVLLAEMKKKNRNSLNQLIEFQSSAFPKATPEIQIVGYKK